MTTQKKTKAPDAIRDITEEIALERESQEQRWGQQDHPSSASELDRKRAQKSADHWKQRNDARVEAGTLTWDGILLEEVFEALAEEDPAARRAELVQVAAVAAAEIEAIDRRLDASASERQCPVTDESCDLECGQACLLEDESPEVS